MNKKEKELMDVLRVESSECIHQATNKYTAGAKQVCKAFRDAAFSAKEFNAALTEMSKLHWHHSKGNE